ncbi:MAG: hypothetical protein IPG67_18840 [Acidobacteria bacterium]|nr:hypothetical protein [Acidobacteriota bacterium]
MISWLISLPTEPTSTSFDSNIKAYAIRSNPPTNSVIAQIATANGSALIAIVKIETIGTTKNVSKNMNNPCLSPLFRGVVPLTALVLT